MTRIRFDQLAKQYLEEFLEPLGAVQRNLEVPGESKFVDVWFTPTATAIESSSDLGLLSRIATAPCLLEPFRNAPTRQEVRTCLLKLLWMQAEQRRRIEQSRETQTENDLPRLWMAATATKPVIAEFGGQLRADWMSGVYFLPEAHKTVIVAIDELPPTPETPWLRILGRDQTQQQAIAKLLALSTVDRRRSRVLQLLVNWRITLEITGNIEEEERSLMTGLSQAYLEWERQTQARGIEQGLQQGAEREAKALILRQLNRRVGDVSAERRSQIDTLSLTQVEALGEALLDFRTIADLDSWLQEKQ